MSSRSAQLPSLAECALTLGWIVAQHAEALVVTIDLRSLVCPGNGSLRCRGCSASSALTQTPLCPAASAAVRRARARRPRKQPPSPPHRQTRRQTRRPTRRPATPPVLPRPPLRLQSRQPQRARAAAAARLAARTSPRPQARCCACSLATGASCGSLCSQDVPGRPAPPRQPAWQHEQPHGCRCSAAHCQLWVCRRQQHPSRDSASMSAVLGH